MDVLVLPVLCCAELPLLLRSRNTFGTLLAAQPLL